MRGELLDRPALKNPKIPKAISDIVLKAMSPEIPARYQRASEVLEDILCARDARRAASRVQLRRPPMPAPRASGHSDAPQGPRDASAAVLLALPEAAARPLRSLSVLRREPSSRT